MELTLKMHDTTFTIIKRYDDITIQEMYEYFNSMLIAASFPVESIKNYIIDKANEYTTTDYED